MHDPVTYDPVKIFMHTATGHKYYPFDPKPEHIRIEVIAQHLACTARWQGATVHRDDPDLIFYSVAEHSVYVADYVEKVLGRPDLALAALLHDGVEGFIGDQIRPVKYSPSLYGPFKELEDKNEVVLAERFGLQWPWPKEIKIADNAVCAAEDEQIILHHPDEDWTTEKMHDDAIVADVHIRMMLPLEARSFFMNRYIELTEGAVNAAAA